MYDTHPVLFDDIYDGNRANQLAIGAAIWADTGGQESHNISHGAYADGQLIGLETSADLATIEARAGYDDKTLKSMLSAAAYEHNAACWRDRWFYAFPRLSAGTYFVETLAVLPQWHGQGVGRMLMQGVFDRAKAAGCRDVQLDLYATNPALHFYQAMGMEKLSETRVITLADTDTPLHYRMIKRL
jgi:ribosomal protein S18 acetylase RimI-like enzyme